MSKMLSRAWSLPPQRNFVAVERNVQVPMCDGTVLLADHYLPIIAGRPPPSWCAARTAAACRSACWKPSSSPNAAATCCCRAAVRLTEADPLAGTVQISLIGAAHRFNRGHRLRIQVAGGAPPRFARNPGNGQVDASAGEFVATNYSIEAPSSLVLSQSTRKAVTHA